MSSKQIGIRRTGTITLEDGMLIARQANGQEVCRILVGVDGLYVDGCEPIVCQKDDPPHLWLCSQYADGKGGGGAVGFGRIRPDNRMEVNTQINAGTQDNPTGNDAGMLRILVRRSADQNDFGVALVATTAYNGGRLWTGLCNFVGDLWKYANPGDDKPYGVGSTHLTRFYSDTGKYMINFQSAGGDLSPIVYELVEGEPEDAHPVGRLQVVPL